MKRWYVLFALVSMAVAGCGSDNGKSDLCPKDGECVPGGSQLAKNIFATHKLGLSQANSCEAYRNHLLDMEAAYITENYFNHPWFYSYIEDGMPVPDYAPNEIESGKNDAADDSAGEFTTTNIQEDGVDEPDIVKNDGEWMYVLKRNQVIIIKAWPAETMEQVAEINLSDYGNGMFLSDKKLIVISNKYYSYSTGDAYGTSVRIYDVKNPRTPVFLREHFIEGQYTDARLIDGKVYLVCNSAVESFDWNDYEKITKGLPKYEMTEYYDLTDEEIQNNIEKYMPVVRERLEALAPSAEDLGLPIYSDGNNMRNAVACNNIYIPNTASRNNGLMILAEISGSSFENYRAQAVADGGWTVYASQDNVYLVSSGNNWYWSCWDDDDSCRNHSQIHRFNIKHGVQYMASGEIDGIVDTPYWMSEYDGHLRVASERISKWWSRNDGYSLSVLDTNTMGKTGGVDGIAKGESIYAVRMFGNKGFVVTFENTDPLFTLDLSDPNKPEVVGKLEIPGYSSYIHPLGENALLTIGRAGDNDGNIRGVQLQIFDVSDMKNPKTVAQEEIMQSADNMDSYSDSVALWDPHAFTYHAGSGLLSVPINMYRWSYYNESNFSGVVVYRATLDGGFERIGLVDHADFLPEHDENDYMYYRWWTQLDRSRFYFAESGVYDKGVYLYTISDDGVKVNDALDPAITYKSVKY